MKYQTKLLALLLALVLVFSLTACGSKSASGSIVGRWKCPVDCNRLLDEAEKEGGAVDTLTDAVSKSLDGMTVDLILDLKEDGTFTFGADEDVMKGVSDALRERISGIIPDLVSDLLGLDSSALEAQLALAGLSLDDAFSKYFGDFDADSILDSLAFEAVNGTYTYKTGKLTLIMGETSPTFNVELNESELKITSSVSGADYLMRGLLPLVFIR